TGGSVTEPVPGRGLGKGSAGPMPARGGMLRVSADSTFHDSTGWPPGSTCAGAKPKAWITGGPALSMRFTPPGRHGGQDTTGPRTLLKPRPQISPMAQTNCTSVPVTSFTPAKPPPPPPRTKPTHPGRTPVGTSTLILASDQLMIRAGRQTPGPVGR